MRYVTMFWVEMDAIPDKLPLSVYRIPVRSKYRSAIVNVVSEYAVHQKAFYYEILGTFVRVGNSHNKDQMCEKIESICALHHA